MVRSRVALCAIGLWLVSTYGASAAPPARPAQITPSAVSGPRWSMVGSALPGRIGSEGAGLATRVRRTGYQWQEASLQPPYPVRSNGKYFSGTVPVTLGPVVEPGGSFVIEELYTLLDHQDTLGDYAVYLWDEYELQWFFWSGYMSGLAIDGTDRLVIWGITKKGTIWSTYPSTTGKWTRYFSGYTSVAVQNPSAPNPQGFLFATSSTQFTNSSNGPSGPTIMLFKPTGTWPKGTWSSYGWGAYQVSADPLSGDVAALDKNAHVWQIGPNYTKGSPHRFIGYLAGQLSSTQCVSKSSITFEAVAVKDFTFLALDQHLGHAVWYYDSKNKCWDEVGSKTGFVSITTDASSDTLVWATDSKGNIWSAF